MKPTLDDTGLRQKPVAGDNPAIWTELPPFVEHRPGYFDGWTPGEATGDDDMDRMLGELYADIAIRHARAVNNPDFIGMVMAAIYFKTARGLIKMGETERGFLNRIARLAYVGALS